MHAEDVIIKAGTEEINGILTIPSDATKIVLFAHGSGSGRFSSRNQFVARVLQEHHVATLLMDLLTPKEAVYDEITANLRFDISFLTKRLKSVTSWLATQDRLRRLHVGYFGASTGAAAAIQAASEMGSTIKAVVSRGGRPDLASKEALSKLSCPILFLVGGNDVSVIGMNQSAHAIVQSEKKLVIINGATHLFEEPGTLEQVADLAASWFESYLK